MMALRAMISACGFDDDTNRAREPVNWNLTPILVLGSGLSLIDRLTSIR